MSIATWFKNLGKREPISIMTGEHAEDCYSRLLNDPHTSASSRAMLEEAILDSYKYDVAKLQRMLLRAITERKTPTQVDFEAQLETLLEAHEAVVHQKFLGVNENAEMTKILRNNLREQIAKLKFLAYDDIRITPEEAEALVKQYMEVDNG